MQLPLSSKYIILLSAIIAGLSTYLATYLASSFGAKSWFAYVYGESHIAIFNP